MVIKRTERTELMLTVEEKTKFREAADRAALDLSEWARQAMNEKVVRDAAVTKRRSVKQAKR